MSEQQEILEALVVRPGDKLLIRVRHDTNVEEAARLKAALAGRFPEIEVTIVTAEQLAVVRG